MLVRRLALAATVVGAALALAVTCRKPIANTGCVRYAWAGNGVPPDEGGNSGCLVCHMDFDGEEIVEEHLAQKITCRSCHGPSEPHRQDETLMTKPDLLWGRAEVVAFCSQCPGQCADNIAQTAGLGEGFHFGSSHQDVHLYRFLIFVRTPFTKSFAFDLKGSSAVYAVVTEIDCKAE